MADSDGKVREIAWGELFPWLILARSVRIALMARVLILSTVGLIAMTLGWQAIGWIFSTSTDPVVAEWQNTAAMSSSGITNTNADKVSPWVWENSKEFSIALDARSADAIFSSASSALAKAPVAMWLYITRPFIEMFRHNLTPVGFLQLLLCGIWELLVWGIVGGAITRIAALKFTRNEAPSLATALKHSLSKLPSYSLAPLIALAGAAVFAVQLVVLGVLMRVELLAMIAGLAWPFVFLLGLMMAILLIGALIGWPLMWATVSVEGTDAFDALSRSYAYTYQRPWRLLWYVVFAGTVAAVSMFVVKAFAASAVALGDWSVNWGLDEGTMDRVVAPMKAEKTRPNIAPPAVISPAPGADLPPPDIAVPSGDAITTNTEELSLMESVARRAIRGWKSLLAAAAAGYQAGFLWVSAVGIYLLLRRDIDGVEISDVHAGEQEDEFGLPSLDEEMVSGVPAVSPHGEATPGDLGGSAS